MTTTITATGVTTAEIDRADPAAGHGVSWAAILAGAAAAAALSLILLVLGTGLGFASVSPWSATTDTAAALGGAAIAWLAFTQIVASATGGYLAGRLRTAWTGLHDDEVYFRDTAHGLLAWAVATLVTAAFLGSAVAGALGTATKAGGEALKGASAVAASAAASDASTRDALPTPYYVDMVLRTDPSQPAAADAAATTPALRAEAMHIFATDMRAGTMGPEDVRYLGQIVSKRTGLSPDEAQQRVAEAFKQASAAVTNAQNAAKQATDEARRAAATAALWMFVALLASAFFASIAALFGGRRRDAYI